MFAVIVKVAALVGFETLVVLGSLAGFEELVPYVNYDLYTRLYNFIIVISMQH